MIRSARKLDICDICMAREPDFLVSHTTGSFFGGIGHKIVCRKCLAKARDKENRERDEKQRLKDLRKQRQEELSHRRLKRNEDTLERQKKVSKKKSEVQPFSMEDLMSGK